MNNTKGAILIFLFFGFFFLVHNTEAQRIRRKSETKTSGEFLDQQWWVGIRAGVNRSKARPFDRYSIYNSTSGNNKQYEKEYQNFKQNGAIGGIEVTFNYKFVSLSFQPNYRRSSFQSISQLNWHDTTGSVLLTLNYEQEHRLDYFEFPFLLKIDILQRKIRPFVQAGYFFSILDKANFSTNITGEDKASGGTKIAYPPITSSSRDLYLKNLNGFLFGAGISASLGNIRLVFDVNYRIGNNIITNRKNRFNNNYLIGSGDVFDDVKLNNISFNLGILCPVKYIIDNKYKTSESKK